MTNTRRRFSPFVSSYVYAFFLIIGLMPLWVVFATDFGSSLPSHYRLVSLLWPVWIAGCFWYANRRCTTERLPYWNGLMWVAASMMTGWTYMSFFIVLPVLLVVFPVSVLIAILGDLRHSSGYAADKWSRIVSHFYRHRMRR
jgi:hypothetical protein